MKNGKMQAVLVLALASALCMALAGIAAQHRQPWSDEGWFSDPAYNLSRHGYLGTNSIETHGTRLLRLEQRTYWIMPLYLIAQAAWYCMVPPTILWARLLSVLWVPVVLGSFYLLALRTCERKPVALLGACVLAVDFVLMDNAGFARPDVMCLALGMAGMAAYVLLREKWLTGAIIASNALVAASGLTHPNGVLHLGGLIVIALWYDRARIGMRQLAAAAAVYAAFAGVWGIYIAQDPPAFIAQITANSRSDRMASTWNPVRLVWNELFERYGMVYGIRSPEPAARLKGLVLLSFAAVWGAVWLIRPLRREPGLRLWLLLWAVYFGIQCVFNQKLSYYAVHIVPIYCFLFAAAVAYLWRTAPRVRVLLCCWVALLAVLQTGGILAKSQRRQVEAHETIAHFLRDRAVSAHRIFGSSSLLYALQFDRRLVDDPLLGARSGKSGEVVLIVDNLYGDLYRAYRSVRPRDLQLVQKRLSEYDLVLEIPGYDVFFHRSFSPQTPRIPERPQRMGVLRESARR